MWFLVLLIVPILALLLIGFVLSAVLAVAVAVVAYVIPVLLIVAGIWLLAKALGGSDRRHKTRRDHRMHRQGGYRAASRQEPSRPTHQQPQSRPPAIKPRRELPIDVQVKAEQIRHKVDVLLGYADRFSPFSQDLYLVRQISADYLPRTIASYLAIPGTDNPLIRATGRTALAELREQLRLLDARLDAVTENLQRQDLDGLVANRRFLEERFGMEDDEAKITPLDQHGTGRASSMRTA